MLMAIRLFILFIIFSSAAMAAEYRELPNAYAKRFTDSKLLKVSVIDEEASADLFRRFASDKSIAFGYPLNGCYVRATQMALIAESQGIEVAKIYVKGLLRSATKSVHFPRATWGWHVAPVAFVKSSATGVVELMVYDPSLVDQPISISQFEALLGQQFQDDISGDQAIVDGHYFGARFQFMEDWKNEKNKTAWSQDDLERTERYSQYYMRLQNHPELIDKNGDDFKLNSRWIKLPVEAAL